MVTLLTYPILSSVALSLNTDYGFHDQIGIGEKNETQIRFFVYIEVIRNFFFLFSLLLTAQQYFTDSVSDQRPLNTNLTNLK